MKFPHLFRQVHGNEIFKAWMRNNQPPLIRIVPQEPLGRIELNALDGRMPDSSVTIVTVRCWNDRGTMNFEAATTEDLKVAQEWSKKHRYTALDAFTWFPDFAKPDYAR